MIAGVFNSFTFFFFLFFLLLFFYRGFLRMDRMGLFLFCTIRRAHKTPPVPRDEAILFFFNSISISTLYD